MTNNESESELRKRYSRIYKVHPNLKIFNEIHVVKSFVDSENLNNKDSKQSLGVRKSEIIRGLNLKEGLVDRCLKYLVEQGYLKKIGRKGPEFFFSVEKYDGTYPNDEDPYKVGISIFIKRKIKWLIEFVKGRDLLDSSIELDFKKMVKSLEEKEPDLEPYNNIVQVGCWAKGYNEPVKLSFRRRAYRYT